MRPKAKYNSRTLQTRFMSTKTKNTIKRYTCILCVYGGDDFRKTIRTRDEIRIEKKILNRRGLIFITFITCIPYAASYFPLYVKSFLWRNAYVTQSHIISYICQRSNTLYIFIYLYRL